MKPSTPKEPLSRRPAPKSSTSKGKSTAAFPLWGWVLLAAAVAAGIWLLTRPNAESPKALALEVSVAEAAKLKEEGAFMLDVREVSEWNEVHMPSATLIPLGELPNRLGEVPQDQQIVVVCRSGNRSKTGRDTLLRAGFKSVTSMRGGMNDWKASGFPTVTGP
jgi:rhodanese-related sulfurtransferase